MTHYTRRGSTRFDVCNGDADTTSLAVQPRLEVKLVDTPVSNDLTVVTWVAAGENLEQSAKSCGFNSLWLSVWRGRQRPPACTYTERRSRICRFQFGAQPKLHGTDSLRVKSKQGLYLLRTQSSTTHQSNEGHNILCRRT